MTLEQIKANWTYTDSVIYKTPEIRFRSLQESKAKVIAQN